MKLTEIEKLIGDASNPTVSYSAAVNAICAAEQRAITRVRSMAVVAFKKACFKNTTLCPRSINGSYSNCPADCEYLACFVDYLDNRIERM